MGYVIAFIIGGMITILIYACLVASSKSDNASPWHSFHEDIWSSSDDKEDEPNKKE